MIQVTDTVRVVHSTGLVRTAFFATVLSVQPPHVDDDGTNGEPTITIGFIDKDLKHMLGSGRWELAYKRIPTVRHVSHDEVQDLATEYCYTEVLPSDGSPVHLQGLNMDDLENPPAEAAEAPDTLDTIVYINHNNGLQVIHTGENQFTVPFNNGLHQFSNLFSATVFVDAQPAYNKSSGDDQDAGDWTQTGDGLNYPSAAASNFAPSAADLDAVVAEKRAAEATSGVLTPVERGKSLSEAAAEIAQALPSDPSETLTQL